MLSLNIYLLGTTIVLFLTLVYVLNILLYKPVFEFMAKRETVLQSDIDEIESIANQIEDVKQRSKQVLLKSRKQASLIKSEKIAQLHLKSEQELEKVARQLAQKMQNELKTLDENKADLKEELKVKIPQFSDTLLTQIRA